MLPREVVFGIFTMLEVIGHRGLYTLWTMGGMGFRGT